MSQETCRCQNAEILEISDHGELVMPSTAGAMQRCVPTYACCVRIVLFLWGKGFFFVYGEKHWRMIT